ncbi:MAG: lactonase family protein [Acidobacteriota bacterium]
MHRRPPTQPGDRVQLRTWIAIVLLIFGVGQAAWAGQGDERKGTMLVYLGTYTGPKSQGIYVSRLNLSTGALTAPELAGEADQPSFLAIHPNKRYLYAVGESGYGAEGKAGSVSAFAIDSTTGKLTRLNSQSSKGSGPCYLVVDKAGKNVLLANYGGGSLAVLPILTDGRLGEASSFIQHTGSGPNPARQKGPHAHSINLDAANRFAVAADLGLDKLLVYRFDSVKGSLAPNDPAFAAVKPGAGPRHFAFHPRGNFAYVINEIDSTITAFSYDDQKGILKALQSVSTLPAGFEGKDLSTAEVQVHPSGKFLYGSNRGHDSIVVFAIDSTKGTLTLIEHEATQGKTPRNFGIDPTGRYLLAANQDSDSVVVFRIDPQTGKLDPTGHRVKVGSPVCVKFLQQE